MSQSIIRLNQPNYLKLFDNKAIEFPVQPKTRTVHNYPQVSSVAKVDLQGGFFEPDAREISGNIDAIKGYYGQSHVGLILPLASMREHVSFLYTLSYALQLGLRPENIFVIFSRAALPIVEQIDRDGINCNFLLEDDIISNLFDTKKIQKAFNIDLSTAKGKGRAFACIFAHMNYADKTDHRITDMFFMDVDTDPASFFPLHYLGHVHAANRNPDRLFLLTAQNNEFRDNHYLFVAREPWKHVSETGRRYAEHLDKIVWSLTGEFSLNLPKAIDAMPFTVSYGIETIWQIFAAEYLHQNGLDYSCVAQVVNPNLKRDGGDIGRNGKCYEAMMYKQIYLMSFLLVTRNTPITSLRAADYVDLNRQLQAVTSTALLPDNENHGPPYVVNCRFDQFIPSLQLLEKANCIRPSRSAAKPKGQAPLKSAS